MFKYVKLGELCVQVYDINQECSKWESFLKEAKEKYSSSPSLENSDAVYCYKNKLDYWEELKIEKKRKIDKILNEHCSYIQENYVRPYMNKRGFRNVKFFNDNENYFLEYNRTRICIPFNKDKGKDKKDEKDKKNNKFLEWKNKNIEEFNEFILTLSFFLKQKGWYNIYKFKIARLIYWSCRNKDGAWGKLSPDIVRHILEKYFLKTHKYA